MSRLVVDDLTFQFDTGWAAIKLDDSSFHRKQFQSLGANLRVPCPKCRAELVCKNCGTQKSMGVKCVDIVAYDSENTLWLIESKDYLQQPRTKVIEVADEVCLKVRDSLACLVAAAMNANNQYERDFARRALECKTLRVGLHLEQPAKHSKLCPRVINPANVLLRLKQLLRSVDPHPFLFDPQTNKTWPWSVSRSPS